MQSDKKNYINKLCSNAGKQHILSIMDWKREGKKQERLDALGNVVKQEAFNPEIHLPEIQQTLKHMAEDDKSDKSIMKETDSDEEKEFIKESKESLSI